MIQGLLTRPATDDIVQNFVESAKGTLHSDGPNFDTVNFSGDIACFGVLRGTSEVWHRRIIFITLTTLICLVIDIISQKYLVKEYTD